MALHLKTLGTSWNCCPCRQNVCVCLKMTRVFENDFPTTRPKTFFQAPALALNPSPPSCCTLFPSFVLFQSFTRQGAKPTAWSAAVGSVTAISPVTTRQSFSLPFWRIELNCRQCMPKNTMKHQNFAHAAAAASRLPLQADCRCGSVTQDVLCFMLLSSPPKLESRSVMWKTKGHVVVVSYREQRRNCYILCLGRV